MLRPDPKIAVVIPCYNEVDRLDRQALRAFLRSRPEVQAYFVNDGSTDGTLIALRSFQEDKELQVRVIDLPRNVGKGEAVRQGMLIACRESAAPYVAYWDADLATPLEEMPSFLEYAETRPELIWISGSRIRRLGADISRHPLRHYLGRSFATAVSLLLGLAVYDTQCGAKLLRTQTAAALFAEPFVSRWIFDVELLARLVVLMGHKAAASAIYEFPLSRWRDVGGSKVRARSFVKAAFDLARIMRTYPGIVKGRNRPQRGK